MTISFTRPDPASPASVSAAQFPTSRRGYDQAEVRDFLRMVAAEQARLQERERFLERELKTAQAARNSPMAAMDEDTATRLLGEEAARVLQTAREAATQIRTRAEESSARLLREATDEAQRLREEAEIEAARRRQDASADSEAELQMAKQQGRDMVNEARAYRERVLSELARRRELARQQIEQLIHGRDRLLQAFERSRIAAVEVMAELTPLGEPNEYVNLQPTTGPVPIMVPAAHAPFVPTFVPPVVQPVAQTGYVLAGPDDSGTDSTSDFTRAIDAVLTDGEATTPMYDVDDEGPDDVVVLTEVIDDVITEDEADADSGADAENGRPDLQLVADLVDDELSDDEPTDGASDAVVESEIAAETDVVEAPEVVSLFAGEIDPDALAAAADTDAADATASAPTPSVSSSGATVGDLFARLRAARADVVVARAAEHAAEAAAAEDTSDTIAHDDAVRVVVTDDGAASDDEPSAPSAADEVIVPLIVSVARKLKRVLADEQNELLDTLRRKDSVRSLDILLPWEADHSSRYAKAIEADLTAAATAGAAGDDNGANPAIIRPAVDAVTNEIVAPLRDGLIRCIDKADGVNAELANQVRSLYREWKTHRIDEHVEDIVRLAYDRGALTVASR